jgi:hypothetical protein
VRKTAEEGPVDACMNRAAIGGRALATLGLALAYAKLATAPPRAPRLVDSSEDRGPTGRRWAGA